MDIDDLLQLTDEELLRISPHTLEDIDASDKLGRCPVIPHKREAEFLDYEGEEALYGGAVGGGKTEALLLWLAEGVQYDNFSGLFLVRIKPNLDQSPTSPLNRSWKFFKPMGGRLTGYIWKFPNGSQVTFGSMQYENDRHKYDGPEYHRIVFDQVEQFSESQYTYMFTRLRRVVGYPIPCGIRSSANPVGGHWVKQRFISQEVIADLKQFTAYDQTPEGLYYECPGADARFYPARIADNPSLEVDEYIQRLRGRLPPVLAAKMANGDWSAVEGAVFEEEKIRRYTMRGEIIVPIGLRDTVIQAAEVQRFATIDTAGTSKHKAAEKKGKPSSYSVVGIWDYHRVLGLFLRHVWRARVDWDGLKGNVAKTLKDWGYPLAVVENAHFGPALRSELQNGFEWEDEHGEKHKFPRMITEMVPTKIPGMADSGVNAKYDRAVASKLIEMVNSGQFWLPDVSTVKGASEWLVEFESELLSWTGDEEETCDQIDVCSHASFRVRLKAASWGGVVKQQRRRTGARW